MVGGLSGHGVKVTERTQQFQSETEEADEFRRTQPNQSPHSATLKTCVKQFSTSLF